MADMITRCPQCATAFRITAAHLKSAKGSVRCGACFTIFNALENLSERNSNNRTNFIADDMLISDNMGLDDDHYDSPTDSGGHSSFKTEKQSLFEQDAAQAKREAEKVDADESWALELLDDDDELHELPRSGDEDFIEEEPGFRPFSPAPNQELDLSDDFLRATTQTRDSIANTPRAEAPPTEAARTADTRPAAKVDEPSSAQARTQVAPDPQTPSQPALGQTALQGRVPAQDSLQKAPAPNIANVPPAKSLAPAPPTQPVTQPNPIPVASSPPVKSPAPSGTSPTAAPMSTAVPTPVATPIPAAAPVPPAKPKPEDAATKPVFPAASPSAAAKTHTTASAPKTPQGQVVPAAQPTPAPTKPEPAADKPQSAPAKSKSKGPKSKVSTSPRPAAAPIAAAVVASVVEPIAAAHPELDPQALRELQAELVAAQRKGPVALTQNARLIDAIEPEPLEVSWRPKNRGWSSPSVWAAGCVLAALVAIIQLGIIQFDQWRHRAPFAEVYAQACQWVACPVEQRVDLDKIATSKLMVRSHPRQANALVVEALLLNKAEFQQQFPGLVLSFRNLQNQLLAERVFQPADYLGGELSGQQEMPVQQSIHIALEIVDPGKEAVSYTLAVLQ